MVWSPLVHSFCFTALQGVILLKGDSVQFTSVAQSCPIFCNPMDCNTPGFPVLHQVREFAQTQVPGVGDAIQPSDTLSSLSPPALKLSRHQDLFR